MTYQTDWPVFPCFLFIAISFKIGVTFDTFQSEITILLVNEALLNCVRIGAIISAPKNKSLLSNPKTSLLLVFPNANSCFITASSCISLKSKRLVQFDPLQKIAFSVLLSSVVRYCCRSNATEMLVEVCCS